MRAFSIFALGAFGAAACGSSSNKPATPDAGNVVTTDLCNYVAMTPTAGAGGTVTAAPLMAGVSDHIVDIPVGTALGGYTERAGFLGTTSLVDNRKVAMPGTFNPSVGIETAPRVKALALTAGDETVIIINTDIIYIYEGMVFDLEQKLGPSFAGKVMLVSSHSHSAWSQHYYSGPLQLGSSVFRQIDYDRFLSTFEQAAHEALAAERPAKFGVFFDGNFDPTDSINRDRRSSNDMLPDGKLKDDHLYMIRIDGMDNVPIAVLPVFGEHGTLNDENNSLASTDAPGALERALQEQFDTQVVVMHLQGAAGDNSPVGHGGVDCTVHPGNPRDPCFSWAAAEGHGVVTTPVLYSAWQQAGTTMESMVAMEMVSRSIEMGPDPKTFTVRNGALQYAPWDGTTVADNVIYDATGAVISPIDEFNAPVGGGLCGSTSAEFPAATIPGDTVYPYTSCLRLDLAAPVLGQIFQVNFNADATHPVCEETRTTISALRMNDYVFGTMPGEMTVLLARWLRSQAQVPEDHMIFVGYSQGHTGYMLTPEDWLTGDYEPSVTFWGPLGAQYVAEQLLKLLPLAMTPMREDATTDGTTRVAVPTVTDGLPIDNPAMNAGTVPAAIPMETWARTGTPTQAQPAATIARVSGIATFTWMGDDPQVQTPHVRLEAETATAGVYAPVVRRSGRIVEDGDFTVSYTPVPLQRTGPQTHMWVAEWQAVPWLGAVGLDTLDDRGGVPLGNYRFHVDGSTWSLDSQPFQVVPGGLVATATRGASAITAIASWSSPKGWRLMDVNLMSNQPVPVRSQAVTAVLYDASNTMLATVSTTTDAGGTILLASNSSAVTVKLTDRFGNSATATIQ